MDGIRKYIRITDIDDNSRKFIFEKVIIYYGETDHHQLFTKIRFLG
ncbi:hypothetical protein SCODD09_01190 [Streptococcus constellatus]|nr:hypothetical protein SCODD09_01190 [Streptococcus constellatus]